MIFRVFTETQYRESKDLNFLNKKKRKEEPTWRVLTAELTAFIILIIKTSHSLMKTSKE